MLRHALAAVILAFCACTSLCAQDLFQAQGEYAGVLNAPIDGLLKGPVGAQVIARNGPDGQKPHLHMVLLEGGLPGAGYVPGAARIELDGALAGNTATFAAEFRAILSNDKIVFQMMDGVTSGKPLGELKKVTRTSPTLGATPPASAVVLFDGSTADTFHKGRLTTDGQLMAGCDSKQRFGSHRLHLEFQTPFRPHARGQGRGNSGVYVQGRYECQILDSFGLAGKQNECGGIYSVAAPITNACLPPKTWQTYDIVFTAAEWRGLKKVRDARMTVHLNGILVHDDVAVPHVTTAARRKESDSGGGLYLQDHGNPVVYRNIWVVEQDPKRTRNVVLLAGRPSHGYASHEHHAGCQLLAKALNESGLNLKTTVIKIWPEDESVLDTADVIVSFADGGRGHPLLRHMGKIDECMKRGAGLVCLHYAVEVPTGKPGQNWLRWLGGYFETHWSVNPHWTANFTALPEHPIARGVQPFAINDEWYFHMRFPKGMESVTPILSAVAPESTMRRKDGPHSGNPGVRKAVANKAPQHVGWAHTRPDGGRAFGFTGGHVHWNWGHDDFRKVVLNAICWCAHMDVPDNGVRSTTPSLEALQANQDNKPSKKFNRARVQKLLDGFKQ